MYYYIKLKDYLSEDRLRSYLDFTNNNIERAIKLYELNIEISGYFHYPLEIFEIMLRNSVNAVLIKYYGNKWYEEDFLLNKHKVVIKDVIDLLKQNKKDINLNNIISNVSFGFWVDFFHLKYKNIFGNKLMETFNQCLDPSTLYKQLLKIKNNLRNRIAHHESIIKYNIMKEYYSLIMKLISFIDSDIARYVDKQCKVKETYLKNKDVLDNYSKMCYNTMIKRNKH